MPVAIEPPRIEEMSDKELKEKYKVAKKLVDEARKHLYKCPKCGKEVQRFLEIDLPNKKYHFQKVVDKCTSCGYKKTIYEGGEDPLAPYIEEMNRKYKLTSVIFDGKNYAFLYDMATSLLEKFMKDELKKRKLG